MCCLTVSVIAKDFGAAQCLKGEAIVKIHKNTCVCVLTDADSDCPAESNPLTLDPPELVVQYGEQIQVNCTSYDNDHSGIGWTNKNETYGLESDEDFAVWTVNITDWDTQAQCQIQLYTGLKCSKDLKLTVYRK